MNKAKEGVLKDVRLLHANMTAPRDGPISRPWEGGPSCGLIKVMDTDGELGMSTTIR